MSQKKLLDKLRHKIIGGFTLVETLVSMGLFLIVVGIAVSAVVSLYSVSSQVNNTSGVSDSLGFVLNDMVRSARLGVKYSCGPVASGIEDSCTSSDSGNNNTFSFQPLLQSGPGPTISYRYNDTAKTIEKTVDGNTSQITSGELTIKKFNVQVFNARSDDGEKPSRALITIEGTFGEGTEEAVTYRYQTTVTQRVVE